jgi:hypothetical protein
MTGPRSEGPVAASLHRLATTLVAVIRDQGGRSGHRQLDVILGW